ncbi:MAG TPA: efflux RND transporter periplasmic adaptor subunit [Janthinobacterium sp.]|nr:efflux RND transporter periplasmic adaptor subunit [Janthinobacterium sp.]
MSAVTLKIDLSKLAAAIVLIGAVGAGVHFVHASQAPALAASAPAKAPPRKDELSFGPDAPQLSSLKVGVAQAVPLPVSEPLNGRIAYDENRTARVSSPIAGRVLSLGAEPGDTVALGAVLAVLDAPDLATAQADWSKAQADEAHKRLGFERAKLLFDGEVLARKDYESAEADYRLAAAETRRAAQRLQSLNGAGRKGAGLKADFSGRFSLRAPIAGVLADKQINPGLEVRPDLPNPLFVVTDLKHLWVLVDVPERSAAAIHAGQAVSIETDAWPDQHFPATVERVGLTLDPATRRIQVRCAVDNPDLKLKPEMFARVAFLADQGAGKAIALPNTSLFVEGMYDFVFVETRPGTFVKRRVGVALRGRDSSFVGSGIAAGERVVTEGALLLNAEDSANAR